MSENKSENQTMFCPKGHAVTPETEDHYTMRQSILCRQCRIMYVNILRHGCYWIRCSRAGCASGETAWMCDKCACSIVCPSEVNPNREGYQPAGN